MRILLFLLLSVGYYSFAQSDVNLMIDSLTVSTNDSDKIRIAHKIAWELRDADWKRALHYIEYIENIAKKTDSEALAAKANINIADIYNDKDAFDVALTYYLKAYEYYQQNNTKEQKYHLENSLAIIYARLNNKVQAMHYFNNLLKHHTEKNNILFKAKTLNNIGTLYMSNGVIDTAMIYFKKSLESNKNIQDESLNIVLYNNLGLCYTNLNDFERAKLYFDKSLQFKGDSSDIRTKAWIYNSLSKLYLMKKQPDSALYYSQKAN